METTSLNRSAEGSFHNERFLHGEKRIAPRVYRSIVCIVCIVHNITYLSHIYHLPATAFATTVGLESHIKSRRASTKPVEESGFKQR
jgi:hypothetical protein